MRRLYLLLLVLIGATAFAADPAYHEIWIRKSAPVTPQIQAEYNNQSAPGVGGWLYSATDEVCPRRAVH